MYWPVDSTLGASLGHRVAAAAGGASDAETSKISASVRAERAGVTALVQFGSSQFETRFSNYEIRSNTGAEHSISNGTPVTIVSVLSPFPSMIRHLAVRWSSTRPTSTSI